jgi:hypothetical protein
MQLEFDITQSFTNDIAQLATAEREQVTAQINVISGSLLNGQTAFKESASIPYIFNLKDHLDSSLYLIKVNEDQRIVAAVDEDPVFDKVLLTLFRLVNKNEADEAYRSVGTTIYKGLSSK